MTHPAHEFPLPAVAGTSWLRARRIARSARDAG